MTKRMLLGAVLILGICVGGFFLFVHTTNSKQCVQNLLQGTGITINGNNPWDIVVHDERLYDRVMKHGSLGLGEAYMDGWWDCAALDQFFYKVHQAGLAEKVGGNLTLLLHCLKARCMNLQSYERAFQVGEEHYDLSDYLFEQMLDKNMIYSCGYWKNARTLDQAQENKLDLICKKLYLQPGMTLLDIGCGWGGLARFAAEHYGVSVVGITISKEQARYAQEWCAGLPVVIKLQDYRDLNEKFDRIVSVGMFEHVGYKNYAPFMKIVQACLKDDGLFLLHTIGGNTSTTSSDPWINKYIFPNSMLPSPVQICTAIEGVFVLEDWHNFGPDYDKTLLSWHRNFNDNWASIQEHTGYNERFFRMWNYYLLSCAGLFRARQAQLWQIVLSKTGMVAEYVPVR